MSFTESTSHEKNAHAFSRTLRVFHFNKDSVTRFLLQKLFFILHDEIDSYNIFYLILLYIAYFSAVKNLSPLIISVKKNSH